MGFKDSDRELILKDFSGPFVSCMFLNLGYGPVWTPETTLIFLLLSWEAF